jgi:hypothetical protein
MAVEDLDPKCFKDMAHFLSADGNLYPCCFVYVQKDELKEWAIKNNADINDLNIEKNTPNQVETSNFMNKFNKSFAIKTCYRECGKKGYNTSLTGQPKWETYKTTNKA